MNLCVFVRVNFDVAVRVYAVAGCDDVVQKPVQNWG